LCGIDLECARKGATNSKRLTTKSSEARRIASNALPPLPAALVGPCLVACTRTRREEMRTVAGPSPLPPPWTVEELAACFVVIDSAGQKLRRAHAPRPNRLSAAL